MEKMMIAVCKGVQGKPAKEDLAAFGKLAYNFENFENGLTVQEIARYINLGYSITTMHTGGLGGCRVAGCQKCNERGHKGNHRHEANFVAAQHIGLDFDKLPDGIEAVLSNPLIEQYCGLWYYTPSSTPEAPRIRPLFFLDQPVNDPALYRDMVAALMWHFALASDTACKDVCRVFYGSKNSNPTVLPGRVLPVAVAIELVAAWKQDLAAIEIVQEASRTSRTSQRHDNNTALKLRAVTIEEIDDASRSANGFIKGCDNHIWTDYASWQRWAVWAIGLDAAFDNGSFFYDYFASASRSHPKYNQSDEIKLTKDFPAMRGQPQDFAHLGLIYDPAKKRAIDPKQPELGQPVYLFPKRDLSHLQPPEPEYYPEDSRPLAAPIAIDSHKATKNKATVTPPPPREKKKFATMVDLCSKTFEPVRWIVQDLLPEGLTIFAGAPKIGKSWLTLSIAMAVANGGMALGSRPVDSGDVLYLALEDNERRLQDRINKVLNGTAPIPNFSYAVLSGDLAHGLTDDITDWIEDSEKPRLVVIDTLAKIRPVSGGRNQNVYELDYHILQGLKAITDKHRIAIVVVHHTRKGESEDPMEMISGSFGLAGGADGTMVMQRRRSDRFASLHVMTREMEDKELGLEWDTEIFTWAVKGNADDVRATEKQRLILNIIKNADGPISPIIIANEIGEKGSEATRQILARMLRAGLVECNERGKYTIASHTSRTSQRHDDASLPVEPVDLWDIDPTTLLDPNWDGAKNIENSIHTKNRDVRDVRDTSDVRDVRDVSCNVSANAVAKGVVYQALITELYALKDTASVIQMGELVAASTELTQKEKIAFKSEVQTAQSVIFDRGVAAIRAKAEVKDITYAEVARRLATANSIADIDAVEELVRQRGGFVGGAIISYERELKQAKAKVATTNSSLIR